MRQISTNNKLRNFIINLIQIKIRILIYHKKHRINLKNKLIFTNNELFMLNTLLIKFITRNNTLGS
jgi:hypothetical protein